MNVRVILIQLFFCYISEGANLAQSKTEAVREHLKRLRKRTGGIKLVGGLRECEGNVEILYNDTWGSISDTRWDYEEAMIVCRQIRCPGHNPKPTTNNYFGVSRRNFWMDSVACLGSENKISQCKLGNWLRDDYNSSKTAGVICYDEGDSNTSNVKIVQKRKQLPQGIQVRIKGGRTSKEGRVELRNKDGKWDVICGDEWSTKEALVVCRVLNLGYAREAVKTTYFGGSLSSSSWSLIRCIGNESSLAECLYDPTVKGCTSQDIAGVICSDDVPDLVIDHTEIERTAHLEDKQMFFLQCAMEENCVASSAFATQRENPDWHFETRRLLKFTAKIFNAGTADFRPALPKHLWEWHMCHMHYHSMEVFAQFDLLNQFGVKVAEGHKASFCLEDNQCLPGVVPRYACANYGDQGISPNCSDIYKYSVDCQWIDITDLEPGNYIFKVIVNPMFKVAEMRYDNNAAVCDFMYAETFGIVNNCVIQNP